MTALLEANEPIGPAEIAAVTGMQAGSVRRIVGKMVAKGEIEKAAARMLPGNAKGTPVTTAVTTGGTKTKGNFRCLLITPFIHGEHR